MLDLSRRSVTYGIASCALIASTRSAVSKDGFYAIVERSGVYSIADLKRWIAALPNRQLTGSPSFMCGQTGEPYVEVSICEYARPADVAIIEAKVATDMQRAISELMTDRVKNAIYWRIPLEHETHPYGVVIEYRDDGPDYDALTDRRCVKDNDWRVVKVYARLTVAPFA